MVLRLGMRRLATYMASDEDADDYRFGGSRDRSIGDVVPEEKLSFDRSDASGLPRIMQNIWRSYMEGWHKTGVYVPAD